MVCMCSKAIWTWTKSNIKFVNSLCTHTLSAVKSMGLHPLDFGTDFGAFEYACHWEGLVFLFKISNNDELYCAVVGSVLRYDNING